MLSTLGLWIVTGGSAYQGGSEFWVRHNNIPKDSGWFGASLGGHGIGIPGPVGMAQVPASSGYVLRVDGPWHGIGSASCFFCFSSCLRSDDGCLSALTAS